MNSFHKIILTLSVLSLFSCRGKKEKPGAHKTLFSLLTPSETGIDFVNSIDDTISTTLYETVYLYNGGGVSAGDIDNDGLCDLLFTSNQNSPQLYRSLGNMKFKNITQQAGLNYGSGWTTGCTMADVNGDGLLDIYICKGGAKRVLTKKIYFT